MLFLNLFVSRSIRFRVSNNEFSQRGLYTSAPKNFLSKRPSPDPLPLITNQPRPYFSIPQFRTEEHDSVNNPPSRCPGLLGQNIPDPPWSTSSLMSQTFYEVKDRNQVSWFPFYEVKDRYPR